MSSTVPYITYASCTDDTDHRTDGGRRVIFLGDLVDRGPASPAVLRLVTGIVSSGHATVESAFVITSAADPS